MYFLCEIILLDIVIVIIIIIIIIIIIHRQVKINDKTEQRFGVVMTSLSSSK